MPDRSGTIRLFAYLISAGFLFSSNAEQITSGGRTFETDNVYGYTVRYDTELNPSEVAHHRNKLQYSLPALESHAPNANPVFRPVTIWVRNDEYIIPALGTPAAGRHTTSDPFPGVSIFHPRTDSRTDDSYAALILHEFAHVYHSRRLLEADDAEILASYNQAIASGLYSGTYASVNEVEYFAELTQAYFSSNNEFPITRSDLQSYDPEGFRVLSKMWSLRYEDGFRPDLFDYGKRGNITKRKRQKNIYERRAKKQRSRSETPTHKIGHSHLAIENDGVRDSIHLSINRFPGRKMQSFKIFDLDRDRRVNRLAELKRGNLQINLGEGSYVSFEFGTKRLTKNSRKFSSVRIVASSATVANRRDIVEVRRR